MATEEEIKQARELIEAEKKQRGDAAKQELDELLKKHRIKLCVPIGNQPMDLPLVIVVMD